MLIVLLLIPAVPDAGLADDQGPAAQEPDPGAEADRLINLGYSLLFAAGMVITVLLRP